MSLIKFLDLQSQMHMPVVLVQHLTAVHPGNLCGSKYFSNFTLCDNSLCREPWGLKFSVRAGPKTSTELHAQAPVFWVTSLWVIGLKACWVSLEQGVLVDGCSSSLKMVLRAFLIVSSWKSGVFPINIDLWYNRLSRMSFPAGAAANYCEDNIHFWLTRKSYSCTSSGAQGRSCRRPTAILHVQT